MNVAELHSRVDDCREVIDNLMDDLVKADDDRYNVALGALMSVAAILRNILGMDPESALQATIDELVSEGLLEVVPEEEPS